MVFLGSAVLAVVCSLAMRITSAHVLLWSEAMFALVFSFNAFTAAVSIVIGPPMSPLFTLFALANGSVHMSVSLVASGILWGLWKA